MLTSIVFALQRSDSFVIAICRVAHELGETYNNIVGDVLLSGGIVAYLGPFTVEFRQVTLYSRLGFCTLFFYFPIEMLHINASFFFTKMLGSLPPPQKKKK